MKTDRYNRQPHSSSLWRCFTKGRFTRWLSSVRRLHAAFCLLFVFQGLFGQLPLVAQIQSEGVPNNQKAKSHEAAKKLLQRSRAEVALGSAFECKVRQRVWTEGREVVGVGTYEQSGNGTGRFHLQTTMHDGEGKHALQQISDGRLAWTRISIADAISLRRVDVSRLAQWSSSSADASDTHHELSPRLRVGGWGEMIELMEDGTLLRVESAKLEGQSVWVVTAVLEEEKKAQILQTSGRSEWSALQPVKMRLALSKEGNREDGFGAFLPLRFEYWSMPKEFVSTTTNDGKPIMRNQLISLIELYAIRRIAPPPIERFRFENRDTDVNFVNETPLYMKRFGIEVAETPRDRRRLAR